MEVEYLVVLIAVKYMIEIATKKYAKIKIALKTANLLEILNTEKLLQNKEKDIMTPIFDWQKEPSLAQLLTLLSSLLKLDEQLFAFTLSENFPTEMRNLYPMEVSRIHTAYGRLASFVTWPNAQRSPIVLSEAGLLNESDRSLTL
jgi:hypothetical protein